MPVHDSHTTRPRLASRCLSTTRARLAHDSRVSTTRAHDSTRLDSADSSRFGPSVRQSHTHRISGSRCLSTTRPRLARLAASRCLSTTRSQSMPVHDSHVHDSHTTRACPRLARTTRLDSIPPIPHDSARPSVSRTPIASGLRIRRSARARALAAPSRTRSGTRRQEPASRSPATPATRAPSDRPW